MIAWAWRSLSRRCSSRRSAPRPRPEGSAAIIACQGSDAGTGVAGAPRAAARARPASRPLPARAEPSLAIRIWVYMTASWWMGHSMEPRRGGACIDPAQVAPRLLRLQPVATEGRAHRREQPVGVGAVLARAQPLDQGVGDDRRRHVQLDRL